MSFAPLSAACFMRAPTTGWASVGFAPVRTGRARRRCRRTSSCRPSPRTVRPNDVGEWQTREQLSMLFVPTAARTALHQRSFLVRGGSRSEAAMASGPCSALILEVAREAHRLFPGRAPRAVGAAHERHRQAVGRARVLVGEAALDARVADVRRPFGRRIRSRRPVVADVRLERAADAAVRAGRRRGRFECAHVPLSSDRIVSNC